MTNRFGTGASMPIDSLTMKTRLAVSVLTLFLICSLPDTTAGDLPGKEVWLPENEVKDRFYSYLIGLVQADTCGVLYANDLERVLDDYRGKTSIPFEIIRDNTQMLLLKGDFAKAQRIVFRIRSCINSFFDNVMVMTDDAKLRRNRLALLQAISRLLGQIADYSQIVVQG